MAARPTGHVHLKPHLSQLEDSLKHELKFRGSGQPACSNSGELTITSGMRDGSAHVLRCLKVWYDLPSEVFFNAVSSIDRFLSKMKAQPKHLSCIAVSAFHLACRQHHQMLADQKFCNAANVCPVPEPSDLVTISQSRCSPSDLLRMEAILANKLDLNQNAEHLPVTSLTLLKIMFNVAKAASMRLDMPDLLPETLPAHLIYQLEIISCDSATLQYRPSEVALALLAAEFQRIVSQGNGRDHQPRANALMGFISELQKYCNIVGNNFVQCLSIVVNQLEKYNGEGTVTHRQRLVWKLSNRTLRHLRPTDKLRATLPTINEITNATRLRSNSECSDESMESSSGGEFEREMMMEVESG